jgi:hypothetical protein
MGDRHAGSDACPAEIFVSAFFLFAFVPGILDSAVQRFFPRGIEFQALIEIGLRIGVLHLREPQDSPSCVSLGEPGGEFDDLAIITHR